MSSIFWVIKNFFFVLWIVINNAFCISANSITSYSDITFFIYDFSKTNVRNTSTYIPVENLLERSVGGFAFYPVYDSAINELTYTNGNRDVRLSKSFAAIKSYLDENPEEILTLFFFYDASSELIQHSLKDALLNDQTYYLNSNKTWPSLEYLVSSDKRLVIFLHNTKDTTQISPFHPMRKHVAEYSYPTDQYIEPLDHASEYSLLLTRGYDSFLGPNKPASVNDNPLIINYYMNVWKNTGRIPNFIFFDYRLVNQIGAIRIILSDMDKISGKAVKNNTLLEKIYWISPSNSITRGQFMFPYLDNIREIVPSRPGYQFMPVSIDVNEKNTLNDHTFEAIPLVITDDLVAYYSLNGNARDATSNNNHGMIHGTTFKQDPERGHVAHFDGDDIITLPSAEKIKIRNSSFSVAVWINVEKFTKSDHSIIGTENVVYRKGLHLILRDKIPYFGFFANDLKGKTVIEESKWYHVVWRYNRINGEQAIFVNGKEDGRSYSHPSFAGEEELVISKSILRDSYFIGKMDDIGIWNRPLGEHEINNLYTGNLNPAKELNNKRLGRYTRYMILLIIIVVIIIYRRKLVLTRKHLFFYPTKRKEKMNGSVKPVQHKNAIFLFGKFEIFDIHGHEFSNMFSDKVLQMFLVLLSNNIMGKKGISSESLEMAVWPELTRKKASNNRRVNMLKLRNLLDKINSIEIKSAKKLLVLEISNPIYCDLLEYVKIKERKGQYKLSYFQQILPIIKRGEFLKDINFRELDDFKASVSYEIVDVLEIYLQNFADSIAPNEVVVIADRILTIDDLSQQAIWFKIQSLIQQNNNKLAHHIFECFVRKYEEVYGEPFHSDFNRFTSEKLKNHD